MPRKSKRRALARLCTVVIWIPVAVVLGGCEQEEPRQDRQRELEMPSTATPNQSGRATPQREFTEEELDSLRASKARLKITRDEYWDERGGVLANEWAEVWYPAGRTTVSHAMYAFQNLDGARSRAREVFGTEPPLGLQVLCTSEMPEYEAKTGREWWHYSHFSGDRITYQPVGILYQRGLGVIATQREYFRWMIRRISGGRAPLWVEHGFASLLSGHGWVVRGNLKEFPEDPIVRTLDEIRASLEKEEDRKETRIAYFNAFKMAERIVEVYGEEALGAVVAALGTGRSSDGAAQEHMGKPWDDVVREALAWSEDWSR